MDFFFKYREVFLFDTNLMRNEWNCYECDYNDLVT